MNIVQIGATYVQAQKQIESSIHNRLIAEGHDSHIIYAIGDDTDPQIIKYETQFENFTRRALNKLFPKNPRYAIVQTKRLIKILNDIEPDLVNIHIIHHGTIDYPLLFKALSQKRIPVVYTIHDMWAFTGGCYHFTSNGCDKFRNGCNECKSTEKNFDNPQKKSSYYYNLKQKMYEELAYFCTVSVSKWTNDQVKASFLNVYDNFIIYNAVKYINADQYDEVVNNILKQINNRMSIICVAGNWTKKKGIDTIIELATLLDDRFVILVVGKIPTEYSINHPKIIQTGFLRPKQLAYLYKISALHISASLEETFGMTFIEAAMQGTRSIGFDSTAIGEILSLAKGRKVNDYSAMSLAEMINKLIADGNYKLSDSEMIEIRNEFSVETMARKYIELYEEILRKVRN